jgi:formamidopyrimidine-DNA glycosylase
MPELPEVQTTVQGLNETVRGLSIVDVWTDYGTYAAGARDGSAFHAGKNNIKDPAYFAMFKRDVVGRTIERSEREGKNVLIHLSGGHSILTHMKMTGHFLYGEYHFEKYEGANVGSASASDGAGRWRPVEKGGPLHDPFNRHIHLVFTLSNGKHLAFSDLRKFAKVFLYKTESASEIADLIKLGPDPLTDTFTYEVMHAQLMKKPRGKIKQVLMEQSLIAGIGNIYSDEMLWLAGIHPLSQPGAVPEREMRALYKAMREVLLHGIDFGGDSDSDYRNVYGEAGKFQNKHNAYRRTGDPCEFKIDGADQDDEKKGTRRDGGTIERLMVGGRSGHFCPVHQKLFG